jgi:hypothetical protein
MLNGVSASAMKIPIVRITAVRDSSEKRFGPMVFDAKECITEPVRSKLMDVDRMIFEANYKIFQYLTELL